jgi:hypothetical protein
MLKKLLFCFTLGLHGLSIGELGYLVIVNTGRVPHTKVTPIETASLPPHFILTQSLVRCACCLFLWLTTWLLGFVTLA